MTRPLSTTHPADEADVALEVEKRVQLQKPPLYKVLIHNDNYTTMEFVIHVLMEVFHKPENEAVETMWKVHMEGIGVAGIYPREIAETKMSQAQTLAVAQEFPLRFSMEPAQEES
ncbi:MAG: ATP-dependent Clp protease adaptor ClpS [Cystobacterineae bacterium]|nr:ATP-dependent Clp protease adaptor ClpS [Cystobacterineae bacterium]